MRAQLLPVALLTAVLLVTPMAGCGAFGPGSQDTAAAFLAAVARGDAEAAGGLTDDPVAATALIRQVRDELAPERVELSVTQTRSAAGEEDTASFSAVWDLPADGQWRYQGSVNLAPADTEAGWVVRWSPAAIHPGLGAQQRVELQVAAPDPMPVVDRAGVPLLTPQTVVTVEVDRARTPDLPAVAAALAGALQPFDSRITRQSVIDGVDATPQGQRHGVAVLRQQDYLSVRDRIYDLPGVSFSTRQRLLGPDRDFAAQLLPGIRGVVEEQLMTAAGWRIVTVDAVGTEVAELAAQPPGPAPAVTATIDRGVQAAAEDMLESVANPAMIVAIQPSTGEILAVAQNAAADAQGALALVGRYPPGSTFKIVTAAAALQAGVVTVEGAVPCPPTTTIVGRLIPNIDRFGLGTVPLRTAFARSCNTTFAQLAAGFQPGQLTDAAFRLGIGRDYDIPGITTLTGEVAPTDQVVQRAENGFGQGRVLVTPFGMALVVSAVAAGGQPPTPTLIRGAPAVAGESAPPMPTEVAEALRVMMRAVVTEGTASALAGQGDLYGKTGTAEYSTTGSHGWFVGFRGDLAFATLVVDAGSSAPAVETSGRFLSALAQS